MTERQRATPPAKAVRIAVAGVIIAGGALAMAGQAGADPAVPYPTPAPSGPDAATPAPAQPVVSADGAVGPPAPPPVGAPPVPEIQDPAYGQGQTPGKLGYLRDIWHTFHSGNPLDAMTAPADEAPGPPPGAGPAPQLPPGYVSLNSPESNGPPPKGPAQGGPPLPPGYYPLNGPPPPGYNSPAAPDPAAPPTIVPAPPTP
ncbi:MAG: hypothetical protein QOF66_5421 [Mycobacterium sp.]|jgi:hypothetical protein|uniref:hypothetical protein n=1 Tax=Mycobacterium sp. TaxID=1785 RepID=UPI0028BC8BAE|nr:hypothetical protein [Mycobacterium sp.]